MSLNTNYLGLSLRSPVVVSASPLSQKIEHLKQMEEYGAGAVVLHSLFEEQLRIEAEELDERLNQGSESFAEALSYFPKVSDYRLGPADYLDYLKQAKAAVDIPIIASLNGSTPGGWTDYARRIEAAGADALELNIYGVPTDAERDAASVEEEYISVVASVRRVVSIPLAVKIGPYFSNVANIAHRFKAAGADGLVLFNRFYQPDIDVESLEVTPKMGLSHPSINGLTLRWIAILRGQLEVNYAATSGIHLATDVVKAIMAGADVAMVCSALYKNGIEYIGTLNTELSEWLKKHDYASVEQIKGSLSQRRVTNPSAFERAQLVKAVSYGSYH